METATPVFLHGYSGDGQSLREFAELCFPGKQPVCIDLPGFGANPLQNESAETDPRQYLDEVWAAVKRAVPDGKVHLVGHSYGAVLAFALAAEHDDVVSKVDLFAPGVFPRFAPKVCLVLMNVSRLFPGGTRAFTWIMRRPLVVDIVTRTMENKSWSESRTQLVREVRRHESMTYSVQMVRLGLHALRMPQMLDSVRCRVPVRIVYATDDTVARFKGCEWLKEHSENATMIATYGGHLGMVAEPERWARLIYKNS